MAEAKILIVEDENIVALDIKNRVEQLGYDACGIVATGEEPFSAKWCGNINLDEKVNRNRDANKP